MNVILYSGFTKRVNSTARPSNATARTFDCVLKQGTSMIAPTIILDVGLETAPTAYTYAYIPDFNRYYWVRDWVNVHPVWHCSLTCDVLASGRSEILAYNAYVVRSSGADYNGTLIDAETVTAGAPLVQYVSLKANGGSGLFPAITSGEGRFILGVVAPLTTAEAGLGSCAYYVLTAAQMADFRNWMTGNYDWFAGALGSYSDPELVKMFFDPSEYIVSCVWIPYTPHVGNLVDLKMGWWTAPLQAYTLTDRYKLVQGTVSIPLHPEYIKDNVVHTDLQYLNYSPFSEFYLDVPIYGRIPLPTDMLSISNRTLYWKIELDCVTGSSILTLTTEVTIDQQGRSMDIARVPAQLGVMCDWGAITTARPSDGVGIIDNFMVGAGRALATRNELFKAQFDETADHPNLVQRLSMYKKDIIEGYNARASSPSYGGAAGSFASFSTLQIQQLVCKFERIAERNISDRGRPYYHLQVLSTEAGNIVYCDSPHVISPLLTARENESINASLETGVFIE